MSNHWVVNEQKVMIASFDDAGKAICSIGPGQMWLEVPSGVAPGNCKVQGEWPELELVDGSADKAGPKWNAMRAERDKKLAACDWTQSADVQQSESILLEQDKIDWAAYRQELRDLPQNTEDPEDVQWPEQP